MNDMRIPTWIAVLSFAFLVRVAEASPLLTVSGFLNDPSNPNLVGSFRAPEAPLFGSDVDIADNVAVYALTSLAPDTVTFESKGFAVAGVDPYFTRFMGGSPAAATFLASNYAQAFLTRGDFVVSVPHFAGDYFIAMGAFANMSCAGNVGSGTLSEGFVGLGQPGLLGSYYYELAVTDGVVTEPVPGPPPRCRCWASA
jgi:hypothetical protein